MERKLDVINIGAPDAREDPAMPSACETHGCGGADEQLQPLPAFGIVTVDGHEITEEQIAEEMPHHPAPSGEEAWRAAAQALVVRHLLVREAIRRGLSSREETEGGRRATKHEGLVKALLDEVVSNAVPTEEECERYYRANRHRFRTPSLYEASHILIEPEEGAGDDGWKAAEAQARTIITAIGNDEKAFAEAAREFSGCPSRQQNGSLGQIRRGELVQQVQAHIEATKPGTVNSEPVRSKHGWHAIRLDRIIKGQELPFEVAKDKIADLLEARSWTVSAMQMVQSLAEKAEIEGVVLDAPPVEEDQRRGTLAA
ncbi:peptidylprolyl isomerase [Allopontixanthobacter sp.]|uniref:peptidylprolyl isomerase n=1 Tax=Allopontixanthobacter sp. TaxID=2906452 RepID=UPI002AB9810E|nr:peptidylprolyl isomerase [Allopontixanthobacter sp.]MDZ4308792.1 peptidylprolyl isomerase [Allopontixanthobacter sp.]